MPRRRHLPPLLQQAPPPFFTDSGRALQLLNPQGPPCAPLGEPLLPSLSLSPVP